MRPVDDPRIAQVLSILEAWNRTEPADQDPRVWGGGHDAAARMLGALLERCSYSFAGLTAAVRSLLEHATDDALDLAAELADDEARLLARMKQEFAAVDALVAIGMGRGQAENVVAAQANSDAEQPAAESARGAA